MGGKDSKAPHYVVFSTPQLPRLNIFLSTLFSTHPSSLNVRDDVSHPYKITGKIKPILTKYQFPGMFIKSWRTSKDIFHTVTSGESQIVTSAAQSDGLFSSGGWYFRE